MFSVKHQRVDTKLKKTSLKGNTSGVLMMTRNAFAEEGGPWGLDPAHRELEV